MHAERPLITRADLGDPTVYAVGLVVADDPRFVALVINTNTDGSAHVVDLAVFLADITTPVGE